MTLSIKNLSKYFKDIVAIDNVSFEVPEGSFICFLGPSGCGKTTLLRLIAGLEEIDEGEIFFRGDDFTKIPARDRNIGMVFQSYSLFPNLTSGKNIAYGLQCRKWAKDKIDARIAEMLNLVQLQDHEDKLPVQLSGGQQQRIALARAVAPNPSLLLLDEPLSALDAKVREELRGEILTLQRKLGITSIMVTHDQTEALAIADMIILLNAGKIEQIGSPSEIYHHPKSSFVADFIGKMNWLNFREMDGEKPVFAGVSLNIKDNDIAIDPSKYKIGIRSEAINIVDETTQNISNAIHGKIEKVNFLGNFTEIVFLPEKAQDCPLIIELHHLVTIPKIGVPITINFPADELKILS